jgi:hypothetical protein
MNRREFLHTGAALAGIPALAFAAAPKSGGETLYNGIKLPTPWPPAWKEVPANLGEPPYLRSPPAVIPIDLGRQLLVDDFLVEKTMPNECSRGNVSQPMYRATIALADGRRTRHPGCSHSAGGARWRTRSIGLSHSSP